MARSGFVSLALMVYCVSPARAQEPLPCGEATAEGEPEPADREAPAIDENEERARRLFLLGDDLYMQGRYDEALVAFEEAYELSGRPLLLYNMANVHERTGEFDQALLKLEAYLPHSTDEERPRLRTRIESLRDRVARIEERRRREEALMRQGGTARPPRERVDLPALLTTLGGVVLLAGGAGLALFARNAGNEADEMCREVDGRTLCPVEAQGAVNRERRAFAGADALLVAGVAAVAIGVWLFLRGGDEDDERAAEPSPEVDAWLGPRGGGMQVRHAF